MSDPTAATEKAAFRTDAGAACDAVSYDGNRHPRCKGHIPPFGRIVGYL